MSTTTEKKTRNFAPRDSATKKETTNLLKKFKEGTIIVISRDEDDSTEEESIGLSDVFFGLLAAPQQVVSFGKYASGGPVTKRLFDELFNPMICAPFEHNEEATKLLSAFLWNKWFSQGNPESFNSTTTDTAYHRLIASEHFELLKDELQTARNLAKDLKDTEYCKLQLCYAYSVSEMLKKSDTVHYTFLDPVHNLRGQLAETVSMNCSFDDTMDVKQEVAEFFVRNQLMLFCKKNHHSSTPEPASTQDALVVPEFPTELPSPFFTSCRRMISDVHDKIYRNFQSFLVLRNAAKERISHSEQKLSKTTFRNWANRTLVSDGYFIKNSYDVVMCKVLNYLGHDMDFSVRGNFQYPISIEGIDHEPEKPKQPGKKRSTGNDPQKELDRMIEQIENLEAYLEKTKDIKRAFDNDPDIQQQLKRQRVSSSED